MVTSEAFGAAAASRWLRVLRLPQLAAWHAEILVPCDGETWFRLAIQHDYWTMTFQHGDRTSTICCTDRCAVHGRDDLALLGRATDLEVIPELLVALEHEHAIAFRRDAATIRTNVPGAPEGTREWLLHHPLVWSRIRSAFAHAHR